MLREHSSEGSEVVLFQMYFPGFSSEIGALRGKLNINGLDGSSFQLDVDHATTVAKLCSRSVGPFVAQT